jgi:HEAT repeat protein
MANQWGPGDVRSQHLIDHLHREFGGFSVAGQEKSVFLLIGLLQQHNASNWPGSVVTQMNELAQTAQTRAELRVGALLLAAELLDGTPGAAWVQTCSEMAEGGLGDSITGCRVAAVQLLMRPPLRERKELLAKAAPLLRDPQAAVRRIALLALASEKEIVREEVLMPLLHDEDAEVQYLCELALRERGLADGDLLLARLITDQSPATRMRVLLHLPHMPELNLAEWLRQLTVDPSAAVRAAAVRAVAENPAVNLHARLLEMADGDPSETVRINARFYLRQAAALRAMIDR